jgi:magnesium transporter
VPARELLRVRSCDVFKHLERVVHQLLRLEQYAETAVQMHFTAQSNRSNDTMRTPTVLTAVFLTLKLIAGISGITFGFVRRFTCKVAPGGRWRP